MRAGGGGVRIGGGRSEELGEGMTAGGRGKSELGEEE